MELETALEAASEAFTSTVGTDGIVRCPLADSPGDRAEQVIQRSKTRDRKKQRKCRESIQNRYGVRPKNLFGYIDSAKEKNVVKAVLNNSNEKISPEFLYSVAMGEGLTFYFSDYGSKASAGTAPVDGPQHIGLDEFGDDVTELQAGGYLRKDFRKGTDYTPYDWVRNEAGGEMLLHTAKFKNLNVALEAVSAELTARRDKFIADYFEMYGEDATEDLNDEQLDYWTYIYYNTRPKVRRKLLTKARFGRITEWTGDPEAGNEGSRDPVLNADIRTATAAYLRCVGVFRVDECDDTE